MGGWFGLHARGVIIIIIIFCFNLIHLSAASSFTRDARIPNDDFPSSFRSTSPADIGPLSNIKGEGGKREGRGREEELNGVIDELHPSMDIVSSSCSTRGEINGFNGLKRRVDGPVAVRSSIQATR